MTIRNMNAMRQTEVMLELVRAAVLERQPELPTDIEIDWDSMMDQASKQGLLAWVWDGICMLPQEQQPPRRQRINWGLSAQEYWKEFARKKQALQYIVDTCDKNHIRVLLLKGMELSKLFPKPESRTAADIDIYLFGKYRKGNRLFSEGGVDYEGKHSTLMVKGTCVENHSNFLEPNTKQKRQIIKYVKDSLSDVVQSDMGYYYLSPIPNLVYLTFHTLKHFYEGSFLPIRNLLDFAFFLMKNEQELPQAECQQALGQCGLSENFEFLVCLSELVLGRKLERFHFSTLPEECVVELKRVLYESDGVDAENQPQVMDVMSKYIPLNIGVTFQSFCKSVGVHVLRFLFCVPKGQSFKETLRRRRAKKK